MLTMHPRVISLAAVAYDTVAFDLGDRSSSLKALTFLKGLEFNRDWRVVNNLTVQTPCKLLPFDGQHVQHRMFERDQCGPTSVIFYRFPKLVSTFDVIRWLDANGIPRRPTRCYHSYDCCGQWYCDGVYVKHHRGRTIASIGWAMNC